MKKYIPYIRRGGLTLTAILLAALLTLRGVVGVIGDIQAIAQAGETPKLAVRLLLELNPVVLSLLLSLVVTVILAETFLDVRHRQNSVDKAWEFSDKFYAHEANMNREFKVFIEEAVNKYDSSIKSYAASLTELRQLIDKVGMDIVTAHHLHYEVKKLRGEIEQIVRMSVDREMESAFKMHVSRMMTEFDNLLPGRLEKAIFSEVQKQISSGRAPAIN